MLVPLLLLGGLAAAIPKNELVVRWRLEPIAGGEQADGTFLSGKLTAEEILPPGWDPATAKVFGRCAVFERRSGTPERIVSAVVRTDGGQPSCAVNVQE